MKLPNFSYEKKYWNRGYKFVAGTDEVGRGSFAGPIVAGCVIFEKNVINNFKGGTLQVIDKIVINDSKKLTSKQREKANEWIKENSVAWGIGEVSIERINKLGMAKASKMAFRLAVKCARKRLGVRIDFLLADAFFIPYVPGLPARRRKNKNGRYHKKIVGRQEAIVHGDSKSISIAAASIIAKVYRDDLMQKLSTKKTFRQYGWKTNKGYGTKQHLLAIKKFGISKQHRKQFVETWTKNLLDQ